MANFPEDLRTLMTSTTAITALTSTRIHYNHSPQTSARPQIWFRTSSDTEERTLDAAGGLHEAFLDIECIGETEADAQAVADAVKNLLDGYRGAVTSHSAQGIFVSDKDDQYFPKSINSDDGRHVVAFDARVFYTS